MININKNILFGLFAYYSIVDAFNGDLTYYGGAGKGGACTSDYIPSGFTTVAMNAPQYNAGAACGACLTASYNINGKITTFNAIVDNKCPECKEGDLDLGEGGDGRWPVTWNFIECPKADLVFTTQGANAFYCKLKIQGGGVVKNVLVNNIQTVLTEDAFWVLSDTTGSLGCGPEVTVTFENNSKVTRCLDPVLFGSSCPSNKKCTTAPNTTPGSPATTPESPVTTPESPSTTPESPSTTPESPSTNKPVSSTDKPVSSTEKPVSSTEKPVSSTEKPVYSTDKHDDESLCISPGGHKCKNGILHYNKKACCPKTCGQCGGKLCYTYNGGAPNCCNSGIVKYNNRSCLTNPPPCIVDEPCHL